MERKFLGWIVNAGYVATRSVRQSAALDANWAEPGTGNQGRLLFQKFGRTGTTRSVDHLGTGKYDSLQAQLQRRFGGASIVNVSYTWSHSRGYTGESNDASPRVNIPRFSDKNYGRTPLDLRHNLTASFAMELPFGKGKHWAASGLPSQLLGGWQMNTLAALRTGLPVTPTAPSTVLNAPGSTNFADCLGPVNVIGSRTQWWDRSNLSDPNTTDRTTQRFGTCGSNVLSGPGLVNFGCRHFSQNADHGKGQPPVPGGGLQSHQYAHFANPNSDISSSNFGISSGTQNTGREGIDHRFFRFGLRLGF